MQSPTGPEPAAEELRVLIVDGQPREAEVLARLLALEGWRARTARTGRGALGIAAEFRPHAVVLDVGLPDLTGLELLDLLRTRDPAVCVLFLAASDDVEARIAGIRAGADDYLTKPFSVEEVAARLGALVRRAGLARAHTEGAIAIGDLTMVEDAREVRRGGVPIRLTATEFELLRLLMRHPRRVLSKTQILSQVWDYDFAGSAHVVELYISYLRKKIDTGRPAMIHTVRGFGYVLKPAEASRFELNSA